MTLQGIMGPIMDKEDSTTTDCCEYQIRSRPSATVTVHIADNFIFYFRRGVNLGPSIRGRDL